MLVYVVLWFATCHIICNQHCPQFHSVCSLTLKNSKSSSIPSWNGALTCGTLVPNCLLDRAGHFEIPLWLMGHPVPAAQTGGGRGVSTAACRTFLPRVCRLHLQVVSLVSVTSLPLWHRCPLGGSVRSVFNERAGAGTASVEPHLPVRWCLHHSADFRVVYVFYLGLIEEYVIFLTFVFISLFFYSLRKKPNERPAYTELMVSRFLWRISVNT